MLVCAFQCVGGRVYYLHYGGHKSVYMVTLQGKVTVVRVWGESSRPSGLTGN